MTFGQQCDEPTSFAILDRAAEGGVDFLDTADVYPVGADAGDGRPHRGDRRPLAARAARARRSSWPPSAAGATGRGPNDRGLSRKHILDAVEASLRRLRTDYIDLYQAHRPDPTRRSTRRCARFDDLVRAGKVRYVGCSNYPAWQTRAGARPQRAASASARFDSRAAALQPALPRDRGASCCRCARRGARRHRLQPAGRRLPLRQVPRAATARTAGTRFTLGNAGRALPGALLARARSSRPSTTLRGARCRGARHVAGPAGASPGCWRSRASPRAIVGASRPEQLDDASPRSARRSIPASRPASTS